MILILYDEVDTSTLSYISYLKKNKHNYCALEIKDIVNNNLSILDKGNRNCTWVLKDKTLDFESISGVYTRIIELKGAYLMDYVKEDRDYVMREWWSYLMYRLSTIQNIVNPISLELSSTLLLNFSFIFKKAMECDFETPEYVFSTSYDEIKNIFYSNNKYIAKTSVNASTNFRASQEVSESTIGLIEHISGDPIFVHVIDDKVFSCRIHRNEKYKECLSETEQRQCISFAQKLHLRALQIIFIETKSEKKVLISASPYPNWDLNHSDNIVNIYHYLTKSLSTV